MWLAGKRRKQCDGSKFISALCREYGARHIAKIVGVNNRTVRRWATGEDWVDYDRFIDLIERLFPLTYGAVPRYSTDMAIDGNTRVLGVGEYSIYSLNEVPLNALIDP